MTSHEDGPGRHLIVHRAAPGLVARALVKTPRAANTPWIATAAAAAALVIGFGAGSWWTTGAADQASTRGPPLMAAVNATDAPVAVRLVMRDATATRVHVAGSWNGWDATATALQPGPDGLFHTTVLLDHGRHEYMFVVDGQRWVTDTTAAVWRDDGFGNRNAVLEI
jgi:hypothetical protein